MSSFLFEVFWGGFVFFFFLGGGKGCWMVALVIFLFGFWVACLVAFGDFLKVWGTFFWKGFGVSVSLFLV